MTKLETVRRLPEGSVTETVKAVRQLHQTMTQLEGQIEDLSLALTPVLEHLLALQPTLQLIPAMNQQIMAIEKRLEAIESQLASAAPSKLLSGLLTRR